jgi:hypothetical protein
MEAGLVDVDTCGRAWQVPPTGYFEKYNKTELPEKP